MGYNGAAAMPLAYLFLRGLLLIGRLMCTFTLMVWLLGMASGK
ncbi:MAG: hypothetical protein RMJ87_06340 [Cytophagales bacterium]|nr:hypothetical protein [Bernardetiaceae bacterium]MDW8204630.1 hypothetical protein [Cytophagales bacterium]